MKQKYYSHTRDFVSGESANLDNLVKNAPQYKFIVDMMRQDPDSFDNLSNWVTGEDSVWVSAYKGSSNYYNFLNDSYDGFFMNGLIDGEPGALSFFNSLSKSNRSNLIGTIRLRMKSADLEQWAYGNSNYRKLSLPKPDGQNPYVAYYDFVKSHYK